MTAWDVATPRTGDERALLVAMLQRQRTLVAWKLHDCDDDVLRRTRTPGGMYAHGVVRHLENVERWWFREVFTGETGLAYDWTDDDPDGEFTPDAPIGELLDAYADECARCDAAVASAGLEQLAVAAPPGRPTPSLRWVYVHMIEETARHLGQLDLLRELADGVTGEQPEGPG